MSELPNSVTNLLLTSCFLKKCHIICVDDFLDPFIYGSCVIKNYGNKSHHTKNFPNNLETTFPT